MLAVAGVNPLHVALVSIPSRVERWAAERFGKISRKPLVVLRVEGVLERVGCHRILKTQLVPSLANGQNFVEPTHSYIEILHDWQTLPDLCRITSSEKSTARFAKICYTMESMIIRGRGLAFLALSAALSVSAYAQYTYIDSGNPKGLPDLSQTGKGGVCGAAAMSNVLWNWSGYAPFNTPTKPLYGHTNNNNYAQSWGADSDLYTNGLAHWIYGPVVAGKRTGGLGLGPGTQYRISSNGHAYNAQTNPIGLTVEDERNPTKIKYSALNAIVQAQQRNVVLAVKWREANGTTIKNSVANGGGDVYHAVTVTGMDNTAKRIAISNPWGDHSDAFDTNDPVSINYYDKYQLDTDQIDMNDRIRIPVDDDDNLNGAFVSSFNSDGHEADYMSVERMLVIKKGGCPNLVTDVFNGPGTQSVRYTLSNPDSDDGVYHAYVLFDPGAVNLVDTYLSAQTWLISNNPSWGVEMLNPNLGPEADLFGMVGSPEPGDASPFQLDSSWQSGAMGLHFFTNSNPLELGDSTVVGFDLAGGNPLSSYGNVYGLATQDRMHAWWGGTSPVPEPSTAVVLAGGLALLLRKRRHKKRD